jgi:hypothetical protein
MGSVFGSFAGTRISSSAAHFSERTLHFKGSFGGPIELSDHLKLKPMQVSPADTGAQDANLAEFGQRALFYDFLDEPERGRVFDQGSDLRAIQT